MASLCGSGRRLPSLIAAGGVRARGERDDGARELGRESEAAQAKRCGRRRPAKGRKLY